MKKYFVLICLFISWNCFAQPAGNLNPGGGGVLTDTNCNQTKYFTLGTLCQDTDDGKLYKGTGAAVAELAAGASGDVVAASIAQTWGNTADPVVWTFDVTGTNPTITATASTFTFGGSLAIGANNITGTGSLGATGAGKFTKGWFVDGEFTNYPTVNGNAVFDQDVSADANPSFGTINVIGTNSINVGTGSSAAGQVKFKNATNNNILTLQSGVVSSSYSMTFPTATSGGNNYLLNMDANGVMDWTDPATLGGTFTGGTLTSELVIDETGIEGQPTDAIANCSSFAATGGGIFYDDSEGKWKKCQDNTLSDLDTSSGFAITDITGQTDDTTPALTATIALAQGGSLIESTVAQIGAAIGITTGSDGTYAVDLTQNSAAVPDPAASHMTLGFIGEDLWTKSPGDTALKVLKTNDLGTNVATALAIAIGSAGAPITFNGALGTPSSGTLTNTIFPSNTSLPGTCTVGNFYIDTDADSDGDVYFCRATNTWKAIDDDGGAGGLATTDIDTSAELVTIVTNETGSASGTPLLVFNQAPELNNIELNHATANTLSASGGVLSVEGVNVAMVTNAKLNRYHQTAHVDPNEVYSGHAGIIVMDPKTAGAITITEIAVYLDEDPTTELTVTCNHKSAAIGYSGATAIDANDTASGTFAATSSFDDATIPSGSKVWCVIGDDPDATNTDMEISLTGTYD